MKTKSICSAFFAVIAVFLTAATALPFATLAQEDGQLKPTVARPNSGSAQPAARTTEELLRQGFELREMVEAQIKTLEQNQDADEAWKAGQIEVQRQSLADLDRKIAVLKDRLAREKDAAGDVSAPGRETDNTKELSLPIRKSIAADLNRQGFRLLQTLSEGKETENKFISPYSIDSAFGMVYTGAKGRTLDEIRVVLGMPEGADTANTFFHAMADQYHAAEKVDVLVSNSVWVDHRVTDLIRPDYRRTIENYYDGAFYVEDFTKKATVADKVNALVDQNTRGMIKDVITADDITERTCMILLNTLFFEAKWLHPFKEEQTRPMSFYQFGGGSKQVRMMYQKRRFDYYYCEADNVHAVVLPYENPRFELVALMPVDPGDDQGHSAMKSILAKIGDKLDSWLANPSPYETRVWLPKVDLTDSMRLKDTLEALGMPSAFSPATADFSGMFDYSKKPGGERFYIEKVIHKTALKMDEYSTKAAAATAIMAGFGGGLMQPPPENVFRADRPYLVLIRDNWTGLILFMGRINDPGVEATAEDGPAMPSFGLPPNGPGSTAPGANPLPGFRPATQTNPRQATTARPGSATTRTGEPAEPKADGKGMVVIEGDIDGKDEFTFHDDKIFLMHLSFEAPTGLTVNGKPWKDIYTPFELGFTPDPATAKYTCEGRGTCGMTRTNDSVTITVYDQQDSVAHYKITLFQPQTPKDPLDPAQERKTGTGGQNSQAPYAGVPLWNVKQDGQPERWIRELVDDAAKRAEANLLSLGSVRTISIDAEHSTAELDFVVVDKYSKIIHFIDEVEKQTPRLSWRRIEIRANPAGSAAGRQDDKPSETAAARQYRLTGQIRVITYTPAENETVAAAGDFASAEEKVKKNDPVYPGDPDFLAKLYDLSLALPEDVLVTNFRFNEGKCDLSIQTQDRKTTPDQYMIFPYWQIVRLQQRIISDDISVFNISLGRKDVPAPLEKDSVAVETIVALNIFDPDRTPKKAEGKRTADSRAADMQRQLEENLRTRAELESLLRTLEQTSGITKEQTDLIRQRIEVYDQRIERLQIQLKALRP